MSAGLWLCIRFPRLSHEALAAADRALNAADAAAGRASVERAAGECAAIEHAALERLAAWAYQWSSLVSYHPPDGPLLWLELGASRALFGGHAALLAKIETGLTQLGYSHVCALAPSPTAAALLTQVAEERCVSTRAQLRSRLDRLPLSLLALPPAVLAALQSVGSTPHRTGAGAARRRDRAALRTRDRSLSAATHRRGERSTTSLALAADLSRAFEFGSEVHDTGALLFPLRRLLLEFQGYLRARDCAVPRFTLGLEHYHHPASTVTIGVSAPARDAAQFLLLARERLQAVVLPAPVSALYLEALEFTAASVAQADFFGSDAQQLQQLQLLLDRLQARLGEDQVRGLQQQADYRPERAWRLVAPQPAAVAAAAQAPRAPLHAAASARGASSRPPRLLSGPERIESGWWDGADATRDYYVAHAEDGARLWVFQDLAQGGWYLQGLWT